MRERGGTMNRVSALKYDISYNNFSAMAAQASAPVSALCRLDFSESPCYIFFHIRSMICKSRGLKMK